jgi:nucleotide-binding universal stress UspA family protein
LLAHAAKQQTDLLIVGSRSHGIWDNWLTGSTIEGLMKESELDIMIARRR